WVLGTKIALHVDNDTLGQLHTRARGHSRDSFMGSIVTTNTLSILPAELKRNGPREYSTELRVSHHDSRHDAMLPSASGSAAPARIVARSQTATFQQCYARMVRSVVSS